MAVQLPLDQIVLPPFLNGLNGQLFIGEIAQHNNIIGTLEACAYVLVKVSNSWLSGKPRSNKTNPISLLTRCSSPAESRSAKPV